MFAGIYATSLYYGVRTVKIFAENVTNQTPSAITMQKQLTTVLTIQSIIPIVTSIGPILVSITCILFKIELRGFEVTLYGCMAWIPVLNALTSIIFIKQYRQFIVQMWKTKSVKISGMSWISNSRPTRTNSQIP
ncbi:unnamed protein product [Bursaphelenchus okinawaensis]|uniref:Uncharacterized protein n=1 Tax=Bursaphelenchus okinawaensis TaxID=465554 RepID=A0A811L1V4_9BILA|nr:unnamed protein product [Bursaphelenchus okinawaensis]CAG9114697.1 unnamed protein product [Bursaphelenchus okinawaensis]